MPCSFLPLYVVPMFGPTIFFVSHFVPHLVCSLLCTTSQLYPLWDLYLLGNAIVLEQALDFSIIFSPFLHYVRVYWYKTKLIPTVSPLVEQKLSNNATGTPFAHQVLSFHINHLLYQLAHNIGLPMHWVFERLEASSISIIIKASCLCHTISYLQ